MNVNDILLFNTQVLFIALSLFAFVDYVRKGGARRRDFFLFAFALGFPLSVTFTRRFVPLDSPFLDLAGAFALFSQPYFLFRLLQYFRPSRRSIGMIILGGLLLCCVLLLNRMAAAPALTVTIIFSYCAAAEAYTAWGFYQGIRETRGTLRRRLTIIAISAAVFTIAFLINAIKAQFPSLGITPIAQVAAAVSAILFYAAFIPPRWLRRAWQMEELRGYLAQPKIDSTDADFVIEQLERLSQTARQVTHGVAAGILKADTLTTARHLITSTDQVLFERFTALDPSFFEPIWGSPTPSYRMTSKIADSPLRQQLKTMGAKTWLFVPIQSQEAFKGMLIVALSDRSLFVDDDLDMLDLLSRECVLMLDNHRLIEELQDSIGRLKSEVAERQYIAYELHDAVTQKLFSSSIIAESLPSVLPRDPERGIEHANLIRTLNRAMMSEMRTLIQELRPEMLHQASLATLLQQLIDAATGRKRIEANFVIEGSESDIPSEVRIVFYRASQECINNIVKHSEATAYTIRLKVGYQNAQLEIRDNGRGFDLQVIRANSGLAKMRERAEAIGASVTIQSQPHDGTTVSVMWKNEDKAAA